MSDTSISIREHEWRKRLVSRGPEMEAALAVVELVILVRRRGCVILHEAVGDGTRAGLQ